MLDTKQLLLDFSAKTGVSGMEGEAADFAAACLSKFGTVGRSPLGSVICTVRQPMEGEAHIMLDAHMDEIGMIVTFIEDSGFLRVSNCGGMDRRILAAASVRVHAATGALDGVICSTPPHLSEPGDRKNKKIEELYIDIGYGGDMAKSLVSPGDRVTLSAPSRALLGDLICGKALDDRAGCVSILKALELLSGRQPACGLSAVFSSMEEVGCIGAKTAAYIVNPTHAIAIDVSFAHTPDAPREKCGLLGKGPMIGFAPLLSSAMSKRFVSLARDNTIPYQTEVMGARTGTNADSIAISRAGVISGLISIPQRYMHTPNEVVSVEDVDNTAKLLAAYINAFEWGNGQ